MYSYPPLAVATYNAISCNHSTSFPLVCFAMPLGGYVITTTEGTNGDNITKQSICKSNSGGNCRTCLLNEKCYAIRDCKSNTGKIPIQ